MSAMQVNFSQARLAMVDTQIRPADVVDYKILEAFLSTKLEHYLPQDKRMLAYGEYEIEIAPGRKMMRPRSFAKLVQLAAPKPHEDVLVVGAGYGYESAIISQLCNTVISLGQNAKFVKFCDNAFANDGYDNAVAIKGKMEKGAPEEGPYDLIFVNGSIEELPKSFAEQLKPGGRISAIFREGAVHQAKLVYVNNGAYFERSYFETAAPPLPGFTRKKEFSF